MTVHYGLNSTCIIYMSDSRYEICSHIIALCHKATCHFDIKIKCASSSKTHAANGLYHSLRLIHLLSRVLVG